VRAYVAELREHLADLTERECAAGNDAREASRRARAALGDDETLAAAMLSRPGVRSWTARAPWLVLGLVQPLTMIVAVVLAALLSLVAYLLLWGAFGLDVARFGPSLAGMGNLLAAPLAALLFAVIAWRQRVSPAWLLAGSVIILLLFPHMDFWPARPDPASFPPGLRLQYIYAGQFALGVGLFPVFHARAWAMMAAHWPIVIAQYALTLLPAAWLWFARRRAA
jgi:hypothetical protein